jgi:hypothetical protein
MNSKSIAYKIIFFKTKYWNSNILNDIFVKKKYWDDYILDWPKSTYINLPDPWPESWDRVNLKKINKNKL